MNGFRSFLHSRFSWLPSSRGKRIAFLTTVITGVLVGPPIAKLLQYELLTPIGVLRAACESGELVSIWDSLPSVLSLEHHEVFVARIAKVGYSLEDGFGFLTISTILNGYKWDGINVQWCSFGTLLSPKDVRKFRKGVLRSFPSDAWFGELRESSGGSSMDSRQPHEVQEVQPRRWTE